MIIIKILSIIVTSSLPFLLSVYGDFVFDDSEAIVKNKDVISDSWLDLFNNDFWGSNITSNASHKSYRPLTIISFRLNYFLNNKELSSTQFKITNLLCHIICCILVWTAYESIWTRIINNNKIKSAVDIPYLAGLLFSVHPIHVEAVSGIVGRADILAAITFFSAFLFYDKAVDKRKVMNIYLPISILLAGMSMLFKENGITILGYCCLYDIVLNIKHKKKSQQHCCEGVLNYSSNNLNCIKRVVCVMTSALLYLYGRWIVMGGTKPEFKPIDNPAAFSNNSFTRIYTYNYIYFLNVLLMVWPKWLCYDWSMGCVPLIRDILDYRIIFIVLLYSYGVLIIFKIMSVNSSTFTKRSLIFAISLMVIPFLPAINILYSVGFVIAERILYIPSAGYCLLICIGLHKIALYRSRNLKMIMTFYYFIIIIFALRTWQRASDWRNEYQLFTNGLLVCPLNAKVHYNVAKVADSRQLTEWAISEYKTAIRLYPEYHQAMNNLANLLKNDKKFDEAESYLQSALLYKKDFPAAWMNLGIVLANLKRYRESELAYTEALHYRRNYPDCYYNLGNLYLEINKTGDAKENWIKAISLNSTHVSAWTNLLALLDNTGDISKALNIIPRALKVLPNSASIHFNVGNVYGKLNRFSDAEKYFLKAIALFGNRVQAIHYSNLGVLYHRWKKYNAAVKMYKMALSIDSNFASAKTNLSNLNKRLN